MRDARWDPADPRRGSALREPPRESPRLGRFSVIDTLKITLMVFVPTVRRLSGGGTPVSIKSATAALHILHFRDNVHVKLKVILIGFSLVGNQRLGALYRRSGASEQRSALIWTGFKEREKKKYGRLNKRRRHQIEVSITSVALFKGRCEVAR